MLINKNVALVGREITLVPYQAHHVEKYHKWMQNPEILKLTASEQLSLDEEYEMQRKWQIDKDKLTFIILSNQLFHDSKSTSKNELEIKAMVGDVNIFMNCEFVQPTGEIEIMIAEDTAKRKGFGLEALKIMMSYCNKSLNLHSFVAKIGLNNNASLKLFQNKLGFAEVSRSEVFQEVTLLKNINGENKEFKKDFQEEIYDEWETVPTTHMGT